MKTILVDDEPWSVQVFTNECKDNPFFDVVGTFSNPLEALAYVENNDVEFALLDIEMPEMNGLELGNRLRQIRPDMVIVYVTAHEKYAIDAMRLKADYFVTKPYSIEDVEDVISRTQLLSQRQRKRIYIRTFGKFDVFVDNKAVVFKSARAKEFLALLVDRNGGIVTTEEFLATVWEDRDSGETSFSMCRGVYARLGATLKKYDIEDLVLADRNGRMINKAVCECDYFKFLSGDKKAITEFNDEYLSNYSWGEDTFGKLYSMKHKF